jgi:aspartyl protease family protein
MGLTYTNIEIAADRSLANPVSVRFLIDSGAEYSVVPKEVLRKLGVEPHREVEIGLADGSVLTRKAGDAYFNYYGERAYSPVIFGEENDESLLGMVTLETLGLMLDPLQRRIIKRKVLRG